MLPISGSPQSRFSVIPCNPIFINAARRKGINAVVFDVAKDVLPKGEYIIMQGGLCHFIPNEEDIANKLFEAALKKVIIAEPIRNLATSRNFLISYLAKRFSDPGTGGGFERFDKKSLLEFFDKYKDRLEEYFEIEGGRDMVGIFKAR